MKVANEELLSIGQFGQLTALTAKALRHYDEVGVLRPAHVDDVTGYRWYSLEQARDARQTQPKQNGVDDALVESERERQCDPKTQAIESL